MGSLGFEPELQALDSRLNVAGPGYDSVKPIQSTTRFFRWLRFAPHTWQTAPCVRHPGLFYNLSQQS